MIHGRFQIDERFVAQLVDHAEQALVEILFEILALGERAHAERIAVRRQHRDALANVLGRRPVHDGVQPGLELPGSLSGRDDEGVAAQPRHARLERGQGAQRGVEENQPQDLARERPRLRPVLQGLRERQQIEDLVAAEVGQIEEALHAGIFDKASQS